MATSQQTVDTYIICGPFMKQTSRLNVQSSIDQIHEEVRDMYGLHLPGYWCLNFYNKEFKNLSILNQNILDSRLNPYQLNSSINVQDVKDVFQCILLFVVDRATENLDYVTSSDALDLPTLINVEARSEENVPVNNYAAIDHNESHTKHLSHTLLQEEPADTTMMNIQTDQMCAIGQYNIQHSSYKYSIQSQSDDMFHSNQTISDNDPDLENIIDESLFISDPFAQSLDVNPCSSEPITIAVGRAVPSQQDCSLLTSSLNCSQSLNELNVSPNQPKQCLHFSLDLQRESRGKYKSDQYNQKQTAKSNGYISRIQGIKTNRPAKSSVLPRLWIPTIFRKNSNATLVIFVVMEKLNNGRRSWVKDRNRGFLPKGFTRSTKPTNPIEIHTIQTCLKYYGELVLDLRMITLWDKSDSPDEEIYSLSEQEQLTIALHQAQHEPSSRLLCAIKDKTKNSYIWETACLSNFIGSSKKPKTKSKNINTKDATHSQTYA
ncbi:unnamed protein product [Rotaria magnacalcarata]|uniref:Uncharacterized protein n=1 Tax=Rotaria magnacalcarata TaxID=392030 RepID=A0A816L020_9BILA|nr:unnamed protein product [Rotaria magnacalcarata]CAF4171219.1 unnamed protein product [Rotaria magnacalcarata]